MMLPVLSGSRNEYGVAVLPREKEPTTTKKVGEKAMFAAGAVAGAGIAGAKSVGNTAYENAPSGEQVKTLTGNAAGIAYEYVPSTEQVKNAGSAVGNTAVNAGSTAASYVPSTGQVRNAGSAVVGGAAGYLPEKVKEYLLGSTAPTTTLPSEEVGQNTSPKTRTAVGPLPGPPGEKDVAVLPDEKTSSSHTSTSHPTGTSTTFKPTLPSDELGHSPSTHTATGPLPSGLIYAGRVSLGSLRKRGLMGVGRGCLGIWADWIILLEERKSYPVHRLHSRMSTLPPLFLTLERIVRLRRGRFMGPLLSAMRRGRGRRRRRALLVRRRKRLRRPK
ncbi:hypothetical protein BDQ17DRAFT_725713 [Cyathus striatus]|nr:hypothetical protein BDQ17DRAFT_725713 [Cyathus striatus]